MDLWRGTIGQEIPIGNARVRIVHIRSERVGLRVTAPNTATVLASMRQAGPFKRRFRRLNKPPRMPLPADLQEDSC